MMRKYNILQKAAPLLLSFVLFAASMSFIIFRPSPIVASEVTGSATSVLSEEYIAGERIELANAEIEYEGNSYLSNSVMLVCPDGSILTGPNVFILEDIGLYRAVYSAQAGKTEISASKTFVVRNPAYEVTAESSSYRFTDRLQMVQKRAGYPAEESSVQKSGLYVELTEGAWFRYNEPIDVSDFGTETPFIRIYPYNRSNYLGDDGMTYDAYSIVMRLTDCYDENNYIEIEISYDPSDASVPDYREPYLRAGAANQPRTGFSETTPTANAGNRKSFYIGDQRYLAVTDIYGARDNVNWTINADDNGFEFYYDDETKCLYQKSSRFFTNYSVAENDEEGNYYYVRYIRSENGNYVYDEARNEYRLLSDVLAEDPDYVADEKFESLGYYLSIEEVLSRDENYETTPGADLTKYKEDGYRKSGVATILIADLDHAEAFDNLFEGFTTGEVYLSIRGEDYESSALRFEIDKIGDLEGDALNYVSVLDEKDPVIGFADARIDAERVYSVAQNAPVRIPEITAYDANLKTVYREVYYEYGTDSALFVSTANGMFAPAKLGNYTVLYTAEDLFGNITTLPLTFSSVHTESGESIDFSAAPPDGNVWTGETTVLPEYEVSALSGAENVAVEAYAVYEDGSSLPLDTETMQIMFENAGEYEIVFRYEDLFSEGTFSYELTVLTSENVRFGEIYLPEYFIKDAAYTLDPVSVFIYGEKYRTEVAAEVYVSEDEGEYTKIDPLSYRVGAETSVRFRYSYGEDYVESERAYPVVDVGFGNIYKLQNYFAGDFESVPQFNGIEFISGQYTGDNTLTFINILSLGNFAFKFTIPEEMGNFRSLEIKLVDFYDRSREILLVYTQGLTGVEFNGATVEGAFENYTRTLSFSSATSTFIGGAGENYRIENNFTSDKILCYITLKEIDGASSLFIRELNNQSITNTDDDYTIPTINYDEHAKGIRELNETVEIVPAVANDVLCPYNGDNFTFTMTGPSGGYVTAEDGTILDASCDFNKTYLVKLTEYGVYTVNYAYEDNRGNRTEQSYTISVVDDTSPTLTLDGGYNADTVVTAELGDTVSVQGYTVSDDLTPEEDIKTYIILCSPLNDMSRMSGTEFFAAIAGDYKVIYYCYDSNGNYTVQFYTVSVR